MLSAKQQPSNIKHDGAIRPNVCKLTFGSPCIYISSRFIYSKIYWLFRFPPRHYTQICGHISHVKPKTVSRNLLLYKPRDPEKALHAKIEIQKLAFNRLSEPKMLPECP